MSVVPSFSRRSERTTSRWFTYGARGLAAASVISILWVFIAPKSQIQQRAIDSDAARNLRYIGFAIEGYCYLHKTLPYHPAGSDFAMYLIGEGHDAVEFDLVPYDNPKPEARWDQAQRRLVGGDVEYLNEPLACGGPLTDHLVILAERPKEAGQFVLLAILGGEIVDWKSPTGSNRELLGACMDFQRCLVKDRELFARWNEVRLPGGGSGYSITENGHVAYCVYGGVRADFVYRGDRLHQRIWTVPKGKIVETVTTDETGRILDFTREPESWRSFWKDDSEKR